MKQVLSLFKKYLWWEPDRPALRRIKRYFKGNDIIGAEIGVFMGENAFDMLTHITNIKMLYLIDPYHYSGEIPKVLSEWVLDLAKRYTIYKLERFKDRIYIMYSSINADEIKMLNEGQLLDFVYIDGDHSYKGVKRDIKEAKKIVKEDGIISGHDYEHTKDYLGIIRAVNEEFNTFEVIGVDWIVYRKREKEYKGYNKRAHYEREGGNKGIVG